MPCMYCFIISQQTTILSQQKEVFKNWIQANNISLSARESVSRWMDGCILYILHLDWPYANLHTLWQ